MPCDFCLLPSPGGDRSPFGVELGKSHFGLETQLVELVIPFSGLGACQWPPQRAVEPRLLLIHLFPPPASDLLSPDSLLNCLYPGDHGRKTPNPANQFQFDKVG